MDIFEAVPNVSCWHEAEVERLVRALTENGVLLADVHTDEDHGRTVFTVFGTGRELVEGLVCLARSAVEAVSLAERTGVHPRSGIVDVVPIVPTKTGDLDGALSIAHDLGRALWSVGIPAAHYGDRAPLRRTADARRAGSAHAIIQYAATTNGLFDHTIVDADLRRVDEIGVTLVGARKVLVACNVWFGCPDPVQGIDVLEAVRTIANEIRETGGGPPGVRALAFRLPHAGVVQLSMNIEQPDQCSPKLLNDRIDAAIAQSALASRMLVKERFELVGLAPQTWLDELVADCASRDLRLDAATGSIEHWVNECTRMRTPDM